MQIINNVFYIILFTTTVGALFTISALLLNRVFHIVLPLWFGVLGMLLYTVPILAPGLFLVSPEVQVWIKGYYIACIIWVCGMILCIIYNLLTALFAHRAVDGYRIYTHEHINAVCTSCTRMAGLKNAPNVCFGTLDDPACVMGILHPTIILNEEAVTKLTETQLMTVLLHEVIHIKRKHMLLSKFYLCVCAFN